MANEQTTPERVEHPAGAPAATDAAAATRPTPDGTRTPEGSNYGDFAPHPVPAVGTRDPSRGAEMERDALPPDADFSRSPDHAGAMADAGADQDAERQRQARAQAR